MAFHFRRHVLAVVTASSPRREKKMRPLAMWSSSAAKWRRPPSSSFSSEGQNKIEILVRGVVGAGLAPAYVRHLVVEVGYSVHALRSERISHSQTLDVREEDDAILPVGREG
ncbi:MAG: hypothetical protein WC483_01070 [Candidatus Paceibacterota bacterium]